MKHARLFSAVIAVTLAVTTGCSSTYYRAMEAIGIPKRKLFVERIESARDAQEGAKKQFVSALDRFKQVASFEGGDLEAQYRSLKAELDRSEARAKAVHERIDAVEDVADALFDEWKAELSKYKSDTLRYESSRKLEVTRERYRELLQSMKRAESKLEPALEPFRDNVLFLKHNLNAKAVASLSGELDTINSNVDSLVRDLERSIAESERFIEGIRSSDTY